MEASKAATQITPGAIPLNVSIAGLTPSGNKLTTIKKKNSVVSTSARRRMASVRSRITMDRQAVNRLA